jgi:hypothetical protein
MLTLLAVCAVAIDPNPSPSPLCPWKPSEISSSAPSSCMVLGVLRSTAVASLWSREKPGREAGGLVGGAICVKPKEWSENCWPGSAGVLPALSEKSDVSRMSGRSAIEPTQGGNPCCSSSCLKIGFQPSLGIAVSRNGCVRVPDGVGCATRKNAASRKLYNI